ncbi:hypothetical protein NNO_1458 [Hydrogenimonas sp.]|nr:hypothetical protein NNO_1458 [Hydrogenimonas sp.]
MRLLMNLRKNLKYEIESFFIKPGKTDIDIEAIGLYRVCRERR